MLSRLQPPPNTRLERRQGTFLDSGLLFDYYTGMPTAGTPFQIKSLHGPYARLNQISAGGVATTFNGHAMGSPLWTYNNIEIASGLVSGWNVATSGGHHPATLFAVFRVAELPGTNGWLYSLVNADNTAFFGIAMNGATLAGIFDGSASVAVNTSVALASFRLETFCMAVTTRAVNDHVVAMWRPGVPATGPALTRSSSSIGLAPATTDLSAVHLGYTPIVGARHVDLFTWRLSAWARGFSDIELIQLVTNPFMGLQSAQHRSRSGYPVILPPDPVIITRRPRASIILA